jgi:hypothetical protein
MPQLPRLPQFKSRQTRSILCVRLSFSPEATKSLAGSIVARHFQFEAVLLAKQEFCRVYHENADNDCARRVVSRSKQQKFCPKSHLLNFYPNQKLQSHVI